MGTGVMIADGRIATTANDDAILYDDRAYWDFLLFSSSFGQQDGLLHK
jgi:hypothetical protein